MRALCSSLSLLLVSLLGLSLAQQDKPDYSFTKYIYSFPDIRLDKALQGGFPLVEVISVDNLRRWQQNRAQCQQNRASADCPRFEWSSPFSPVSESQAAAQDLRKAWQRFEERYWWRVEVELNNPLEYLLYCTVDWGARLNPPRPEVQVNVSRELLPRGFDPGVGFPAPDPRFYLDRYLPWPQVPKDDYCDDLNLQLLPLMYLPGFCVQLEGVRIACTPNFPAPLWFNWEEATARVTRAIARAHSKYLLEYQKDVAEALLPGKRTLFFPFPWRSHLPDDGAVITPVFDLDPHLEQFQRLAQTASEKLGGLEGANAYAYYFQHNPLLPITRSPTLDLHLLPGRTDVLYTPPGVWKLEELKRWLGPSTPTNYEFYGYVNFFQAWSQVDATVLPEGKPLLRNILYDATAIIEDCHLFGACVSVPIPVPIPIPPFKMLFAGPRTYWGWVSVPEGYEIPRVKGEPLLDVR